MTAYEDGMKVTTYAEMWENVQRLGHELYEMGVGADEWPTDG